MELQRKPLEFHTTKYNVLIPILVSTLVFLVEIRILYYGTEECVSYLNICRLLNTTFIPTHIATVAVFLYQHFSLANYYNNGGKMRSIDDMEVKAENAGLTMISTILLAFFYVFFSSEINCKNQTFLMIMQCIYMWILFKFSIRNKVVIVEEPVKNVVSY